MAGIGIWGLIIIGAIVVVVFGTARFGRAFRSIKSGGREFKRGIRGEDKQLPPQS